MFFVQYRGNRKSHLSRVKNAKFPARFQALSGEGALLFQNILLLLYTISPATAILNETPEVLSTIYVRFFYWGIT